MRILRNIWRWLRGGSYRCDGCEKIVSRRSSIATPRTRQELIEIPKDVSGDVLNKGAYIMVGEHAGERYIDLPTRVQRIEHAVELLCPACVDEEAGMVVVVAP